MLPTTPESYSSGLVEKRTQFSWMKYTPGIHGRRVRTRGTFGSPIIADIVLPIDTKTIDITRLAVNLRFLLGVTWIYRYSVVTFVWLIYPCIVKLIIWFRDYIKPRRNLSPNSAWVSPGGDIPRTRTQKTYYQSIHRNHNFQTHRFYVTLLFVDMTEFRSSRCHGSEHHLLSQIKADLFSSGPLLARGFKLWTTGHRSSANVWLVRIC